MKIKIAILFLLSWVHFAAAQTLCTKQTVIKPLFQNETKKILDTPAVYEYKSVSVLVKDGFWDIEYKSGMACKVWKEPEFITYQEPVLVVPPTFKNVIVLKLVRNGEIHTYLGDCN